MLEAETQENQRDQIMVLGHAQVSWEIWKRKDGITKLEVNENKTGKNGIYLFKTKLN